MAEQRLLAAIAGVQVWQDPPIEATPARSGNGGRIHYIADMDVDVDGAAHSYRLDNMASKGALDDIEHSAGFPDQDWWNVLVPNPKDRKKPFVDENGFCVSMTSYQRPEFPSIDRRRYLDAAIVPYSVIPGRIRTLCKGILLGCKAKITDIVTDESIETVCGDFSGGNIGEASLAAANFFDATLNARNGDSRKRYLYEFWPGVPAFLEYGEPVITEHFKLIPAGV